MIGAYRAQVGEGSWWDTRRSAHWSVDVFAPALIRTELSGVQTIWPMPEMAGGVVTCDDGTLLIAMETGLFAFDPDAGGEPKRVAAPDNLPGTHRFNDLTVDPLGRLIVGTMRKSALGREPTGILYLFDGDRWRILVENLVTINGLACSADGRTLYWSDSAPEVNRIWRADYDPAEGTLGPASVFCDMREQRGRPDGAAMDLEGHYWLAAIGGGCLHRFRSDGRIERTVDVPADHPTKPAFGGPAMDLLLVTTLSIRESRPEAVNAAGAILSLDAPAKGVRPPDFAGASRPIIAQGGETCA
jgi:sugar lactone lactonase YvrE